MAEGIYKILLKGHEFVLLPEKAAYWPARRILIVSDLHLGKAGHFRKHGIPIPSHIHHHDLYVLTELCNRWEVNHVVFLGDLFHSEPNEQWRQFEDWVSTYGCDNMTLIRGNHDILPESFYSDLGLVVKEELTLGCFSFTHEEKLKGGFYNISGHLHPGIKLKGMAKQGLKVPCFYFRPENAYMPAFGKFTGLYTLRKRNVDKVFGIAADRVFSI